MWTPPSHSSWTGANASECDVTTCATQAFPLAPPPKENNHPAGMMAGRPWRSGTVKLSHPWGGVQSEVVTGDAPR